MNCDLRWYTPQTAGDAKFYEDLQQVDWYYQEHKPEYDFARTLVKQADRVLEVGCGKGAFRKFLPENVTYHGLEFNQAAVKTACASGLDVKISPIEAHAAENPASYDVVCHFQVLEHVTTPLPFLQACVAALKPGGTLVVAVPSEDSFLRIVENGWLNMPPHHMTRWSDRSLKDAFSALHLVGAQFCHEPVADYHRDWYRAVMRNFTLKHSLGIRIPLLGDRQLSRIGGRLARIESVGAWLDGQAERQFKFAKNGHTVCAAATKAFN